jgi:hypothetical protein
MELRFAVVVMFFIFAAFCVYTSHSQGKKEILHSSSYLVFFPSKAGH